MSLLDVTLEQLQAATVAQIRTQLKTKIDTMSKVKLIRLILTLQNWAEDAAITVNDSDIREYHPDGQAKKVTRVQRDILGAKTGSQVTEWTYYPTNEVNEIVTRRLDANDAEVSRQTVKHFMDGKQPEVS